MGATAVLIRKELRQHWLPFAFLATLLAIGAAGALAGHYLRGRSSSVFTGVRMFLQLALPASAMLICGRLVVAEFRAKTQLFLEALPLPRWRMIGIKYCFGLGALWLFSAAVLATAGLVLSAHEAMTPRFAAILASRAAACAWFWHAFFFTTCLLGRYRWAIMILIVMLTLAVDAASGWDARQFGPFVLLDERFGAERQHFPVEALRETIAAAGGLTVLAFVLALMREGSVSSLMAERMSHREKVLVAVILLGATAATGLLEQHRAKAPYDLRGAAAATGEGALVKVAGPRKAAGELAEALRDELVELRGYLGIAALPPVFVVNRVDLDVAKFERGQLAKAEGFVVRANYTAPAFDRARFVAWLAPQLLDYRSHDRTLRESGRWVRDGIGEFWVRRARIAQPLVVDRELALRAAYATARVSGDDLEQWHRVRERVGEGVSIGLAWSGLKTIAAARGEVGCRDFLRRLYAKPVPDDVRATIRDLRHPWTKSLGMGVDELIAAWNAALAQSRRELAEDLAALPRLDLAVAQKPVTSAATLLQYELTVANAPAGEAAYRVRYLSLPGLDEPFDEDDLLDEAARGSLDKPVAGELAESFPRGGRVVVGAAMFVPALRCEAISGWRRIDIGP